MGASEKKINRVVEKHLGVPYKRYENAKGVGMFGLGKDYSMKRQGDGMIIVSNVTGKPLRIGEAKKLMAEEYFSYLSLITAGLSAEDARKSNASVASLMEGIMAEAIEIIWDASAGNAPAVIKHAEKITTMAKAFNVFAQAAHEHSAQKSKVDDNGKPTSGETKE